MLQIHCPREDESPDCFHRSLLMFTCLNCPDQFKVARCQLPLENGFYSKTNPSDNETMVLMEITKEKKGMVAPDEKSQQNLTQYQSDMEIQKKLDLKLYEERSFEKLSDSEFEVQVEGDKDQDLFVSNSAAVNSDSDSDSDNDLLDLADNKRYEDMYREHM